MKMKDLGDAYLTTSSKKAKTKPAPWQHECENESGLWRHCGEDRWTFIHTYLQTNHLIYLDHYFNNLSFTVDELID